MPKTSAATELRKMTPQDLSKEISDKRAGIAKMRISVAMRSQKDTAQYRREKKDLARMLTIMNELNRAHAPKDSALKPARKASKVPVSAKATAGKSASTSI